MLSLKFNNFFNQTYNQERLYKVFFLFLFIFQIYFAVNFHFERLYADSGYYFFKLINEEKFQIEHTRFVLFFSQFPTFVFLKLNASLKSLVLVYSLTPVIVNFIFATICLLKFKNKQATLILILSQFIGIKHCLFTPQFEYFYGFSFFVLGISKIQFLIQQNKFRIMDYFILSLLFLISFTSHPMMIFISLVIIIIMLLNEKKFRKNIIFLNIILFIGYFIIKKLFPSEYETAKFRFLKDYISYNEVFNFYYFKNGFLYFVKYHFDSLILIIVVAFSIKYSKKNLLIFISFMLLILSLIWFIQLPGQYENTRYNEQIYFTLSSSILLMFLFFKLKIKNLFILIVLVSVRIFLMLENSNLYVKRTEFMKELSNETKLKEGNKFYIANDKWKDKIEIMNWSFPFETLIYSSIYFSKHSTICTEEDYEFNRHKIKDDEFIFRKWDIIKTQSLNKIYFNLKIEAYAELK